MRCIGPVYRSWNTDEELARRAGKGRKLSLAPLKESLDVETGIDARGVSKAQGQVRWSYHEKRRDKVEGKRTAL